MKWLAMAAVLGTFGARWAMVTMDDAALRDDVLFNEMLTSTRNRVDAAAMEPFITRLIQQRHYELVPDSLQIDVGDSREGVLKIQGAGMQIQGKGPTRIQDIEIRFDCRRPGTFFTKTVAKYRLHTEAPGDGRANHWPRQAGEESGPP